MNKENYEKGKELSIELDGGYDMSQLSQPTPESDEVIKRDLERDNTSKPDEAQADEQISSVMCSDSGWINCADRLPESGETVLTHSDYGYVVATFDGKWFRAEYTDYESGEPALNLNIQNNYENQVKYWMPLPEPPNH